MQRINRFCEKSPWAGIELPHATRLEVDPATHSQWSHPWNPCCGHWANGPRVEDKSAELGVWPAWVAVKLLQAPGKVQNCCWYQYQCLHQSEQLLEALGSICEVEESSHAKTEWVATPLTSYEASLVIVVQHGWLKAPSLHRIRMPYHQGLQQPIENPWYSTWRNIGKRFESIWEGTCMKRKSVIIDSVASNIVTCLNYLVQKGERKQTCEINMIKIKIAASVESQQQDCCCTYRFSWGTDDVFPGLILILRIKIVRFHGHCFELWLGTIEGWTRRILSHGRHGFWHLGNKTLGALSTLAEKAEKIM